MIRRYGEPVNGKREYTRRPGAYALLLQGRDALLTVQDGMPPDVQLPGGGIDPGESPLQALHREVLEETGWRIRLTRKLGAFRRFTFMPDYDLWAEKICHIYLGAPTLQVTDPVEADHSTVWMPLVTAAGLLGNAGDRAFAAHALRWRGK